MFLSTTLTLSAGGLVEPARPGPPLLADLGPRLLRRPLDGGLVSLLEGHTGTTQSAAALIHAGDSSFSGLEKQFC